MSLIKGNGGQEMADDLFFEISDEELDGIAGGRYNFEANGTGGADNDGAIRPIQDNGGRAGFAPSPRK